MLLHTTLLRHETRGTSGGPGSAAGPHYDWLIVPPDGQLNPEGRLWTARAEHHWNHWASAGSFLLTALPPHRRRYLRWQGTLTGERGHVYNAGRGHVEPHLWTPERLELTLHRPIGAPLALRLERLHAERWRVVPRL